MILDSGVFRETHERPEDSGLFMRRNFIDPFKLNGSRKWVRRRNGRLNESTGSYFSVRRRSCNVHH
jgi:hypothetical protein